MPITVDPASEYAKLGAKPPENDKLQELGIPTSGVPQGTPIPEGQVVSQRVGRGQAPPSMMVVPPKIEGGPPPPQIAVVPPTGAGRTTVGTFVEQPAKILEAPVKTNPLEGATEAIPPIEEWPQIAEAPKPPKRPKLDLVKEILDHMNELGGEKSEKCQKFYGRSPASIKNYLKDPGSMPLECVLRFLAKKPELLIEIEEDLEPHFEANGPEGSTTSYANRGKTSVMICSAILERPTLPFLWVVAYLTKKYELGLAIQADTMIGRSRNMLADRFLKSNHEWSLWIDGDIAAPIANKDWYKWITGSEQVSDIKASYDVLTRLQSHQKGIVGGVYASRKFHGSLVIQPDVKPRNPDDRTLSNEIRRGTATGLAQVDWIGFGCALVHRTVFLEVQRRFPQLAPEHEFAPWRYFQVLGDEGEDEAFCQRVRACEIPIWLDTQLVCAHIGNFAFLPEHTSGMPTL